MTVSFYHLSLFTSHEHLIKRKCFFSYPKHVQNVKKKKNQNKSLGFFTDIIKAVLLFKLSALLNILGCGWKPSPGKRDLAQDTKCLQTAMIHSLGHVGPQTDRKVDYGLLYDWVYILLGATDHGEILPWRQLLNRSRLTAWTIHSCLFYSR